MKVIATIDDDGHFVVVDVSTDEKMREALKGLLEANDVEFDESDSTEELRMKAYRVFQRGTLELVEVEDPSLDLMRSLCQC